MIQFESGGITYFLTYSEDKGFTYYEEEIKDESECIIKPIVTTKRLSAYQNNDSGYFKSIYEKEEALNMSLGDGYIYI